jgi:hypothetical protein
MSHRNIEQTMSHNLYHYDQFQVQQPNKSIDETSTNFNGEKTICRVACKMLSSNIDE